MHHTDVKDLCHFVLEIEWVSEVPIFMNDRDGLIVAHPAFKHETIILNDLTTGLFCENFESEECRFDSVFKFVILRQNKSKPVLLAKTLHGERRHLTLGTNQIENLLRCDVNSFEHSRVESLDLGKA